MPYNHCIAGLYNHARWDWRQGQSSVRTKSSRRSAPAGWARCIARAIPASIARSRSRFCPLICPTRPEAGERFEREAQPISSLNHPNICQLYDVGQQNGVRYLVMELLEGETLAERLRADRCRWSRYCVTAAEIADGLDAAHRCGVVHRDLKPGNIMLTKSGAKLMDFGLAKGIAAPIRVLRRPDRNADQFASLHPLTQQGTIVGTFQYMSPEQVEGKEADARSDIFALGAVLYEMVTRQARI